MRTTRQRKKLAKNVFDAFCEVLDENDLEYSKKDNSYLECIVFGEDLPVKIEAIVDEDDMIVFASSPLPFGIPKDRRDVIAVAVSEINVGLLDGFFDFDYATGDLRFRAILSFANSIVGKEALLDLFLTVQKTVERYNDKLLFISKNDMNAKKAIECLH